MELKTPLAPILAVVRPLNLALHEIEVELTLPPEAVAEGAVAAFLGGLEQVPALRWLPPELAPPGPFLPDRPWAPAKAFPALADTTQMLQPSLFDDLD